MGWQKIPRAKLIGTALVQVKSSGNEKERGFLHMYINRGNI